MARFFCIYRQKTGNFQLFATIYCLYLAKMIIFALHYK